MNLKSASLKSGIKKIITFIGNFSVFMYRERKPQLIVLICLFDIILVSLIIYITFFSRYYWEGEYEKRFQIKSGKNLDEIISDLKQSDVIKSELLFKLVAKISGKEGKIISRQYIFHNGMNNAELLYLLTDKTANQIIRFTVIEGLTLKQISKLAEKKLFLLPEKFLKECENDSLLNLINLKGKVKNLEGFLFPDTYLLPLDIDEKSLIEIMFKEFYRKVFNDKQIKKKIEEEKANLLNIITLASIIQGETPVKSEMPVVSGVYHNRLKKNMRLEADPTVQYSLPDGPKPRLTYEDLKVESPYNTYKVKGLPPGPVNNPGLNAINAALNPEQNDFYFFVATGDGGHKFSKTFEEHKIAVQQYREKQKK